jgi:hypothetical protein
MVSIDGAHPEDQEHTLGPEVADDWEDGDEDEDDGFDYPPPLDQLLTLGNLWQMPERPDYLALGFGPEHIPELIRMATDDELMWDTDDEGTEVWAPVHAWNVLGLLHAEAAIDPLLDLFDELEDTDWLTEEMHRVFGDLGPAAIPALAVYLADRRHKLYSRITAVASLEEIGKRYPHTKAVCAAAMTTQLEAFRKNDPELNGFLIEALVTLNAVEAAPLMERAFASGRVDPLVLGDWEDVQRELGLEPVDGAPQRSLPAPAHRHGSADTAVADAPRAASARTKAKSRSKMAAQSRRKNRKRK